MGARVATQRIALVLGSGGIVGGAFHAGVLKALLDTWNLDARKVDLILGTSAGSIVGALTVAGLHPNDLFRRETAKPLSPSGQKLLARARAKRGPKPHTRSAIGRPAAPEALLRAVYSKGEVSPGSLAAALLPRGRASTAHVAGLVEGLLGPSWPEPPGRPDLKICSVEVSSAQRVVFGRDGRASPSEAVASSCAVPAVFAPVKIGDREYLDGGMHSADNLDVLATDTYDLVVVSSPMTSGHQLSGSPAWAAIRAANRWQTDYHRQLLRGCPHVEIVRPGPKDLDAMGSNLLDTRRRPAVAAQAHATASAQLSQRPNPIGADQSR